jgi:hypothetical protein
MRRLKLPPHTALPAIAASLAVAMVTAGPAWANPPNPPTTSPSPAAGDCTATVVAAFEKQRTGRGYRMVTRQQSDRGEIVNTVDYLAPDRMHNVVVAPGEPHPLETIAIGRWAWANQGGGWQELQPQFAQSVTSHVATTLRQPIAPSEPFSCAGLVTRGERSFEAYRTEPRLVAPNKPEGTENPKLVRTILVDPATGLPAFNIVGGVTPSAPTVAEVAYSYPADLAIEAPDAVPANRNR